MSTRVASVCTCTSAHIVYTFILFYLFRNRKSGEKKVQSSCYDCGERADGCPPPENHLFPLYTHRKIISNTFCKNITNPSPPPQPTPPSQKSTGGGTEKVV